MFQPQEAPFYQFHNDEAGFKLFNDLNFPFHLSPNDYGPFCDQDQETASCGLISDHAEHIGAPTTEQNFPYVHPHQFSTADSGTVSLPRHHHQDPAYFFGGPDYSVSQGFQCHACLDLSMTMEAADEHSMAHQEAAAREFQQEYQGPHISDKIPSTEIAQEYAKADSDAFVKKTSTLPKTYSHFRRVRGDGNCGYRAIAFGYFETLVAIGDSAKCDAEIKRLEALKSYLHTVGGFHMENVVEFFSIEFLDLIDALSMIFKDRDARFMKQDVGEEDRDVIDFRNEAETLVLQKFNDPGTEQCLVFYLRLIASAGMKGKPEYGGFISEGLTAEAYAVSTIEQLGKEIEDVAVEVLSQMLLVPADIVLELAYLDGTSRGEQVDIYYKPEGGNMTDAWAQGRVIRLLYRPGHIDLLYPISPSPALAQVALVGSTDLEVNYFAFVPPESIFASPEEGVASSPCNPRKLLILDIGVLNAIPGFDCRLLETSSHSIMEAPTLSPWSPPLHVSSPSQSFFESMDLPGTCPFLSPASTTLSVPSHASPSFSQASTPSFVDSMGSPQSGVSVSTVPPTASTHSFCSSTENPTPIQQLCLPLRPVSRLRLNKYCNMTEYAEIQKKGTARETGQVCVVRGDDDPPRNMSKVEDSTAKFSTKFFKNSHFNVAHFNNPNFQPEEYKPNAEDNTSCGGLGGHLVPVKANLGARRQSERH